MKEQDTGVKWFNTVFYPGKKTGRAVGYEDKILPRLREQHVTLFTPWGPRYDWETRGSAIREGDKEIEALDFLITIFQEWDRNMPDKNFQWIVLGADLYGTRINKLPSDAVAQYFVSLQERLTISAQILPQMTMMFRLWSEFDECAQEHRDYVRTRIDGMLSCQLIHRAVLTAGAMQRGGDPMEYLVERIAEAMLIEKIFRPIKISCVGRHKDNEVDRDLPRLYFVPEALHSPWM